MPHLVGHGLIQHAADVDTDEAAAGHIMQGADAPASPRCLEQLQLESEGVLHHLVEAVVAALTPVCKSWLSQRKE